MTLRSNIGPTMALPVILSHSRTAVLAICIVASCVKSVQAQTVTSDAAQIDQLVVKEGVPLRVIVTEKLRYKKNQPVHARIVEPVYSFDREVLPSGTEVLGRITGFQSAPRWARITSMLGGNFTPLRQPVLAFDTLMLKDGRSLPIQTSVSAGSDTVVRFKSGPAEQKKGRVATATEAARQQIEARKRAVIDSIKAPGKMDRVKEAMWSFAPWHPQYLPAASRFNAKLLAPLEFGDTSIPVVELTGLGSEPPADAILAARLITSLDSRTTAHGASVEALLTRPLVSGDNHLIFPEGSRLHGTVVQGQPARRWHRSGKLAFMFTGIEPVAPSSVVASPSVQEIEGRLESVESNSSQGKIQMDEEGGTSGASSNKRFIMPAISLMMAMQSADGLDHHHPDADDPVSTHPYSNHYGSRVIAGGFGFGLLGSALGRLSHPIAPVLGFYGAGRSIYSNVVARGQEVTFPADTPIEIRLSSRTPNTNVADARRSDK
jgi:hypothetical protein